MIKKSLSSSGPQPNLRSYDGAYRSFSWHGASSELDLLPGGGGLNIAYEAVDRHVANGHGKKAAIRWHAKTGNKKILSYEDLYRQSNQFANALKDQLGTQKGNRVFSLCGRIPELYVAFLGSLKHRCVFSPLFSAFGPEPIKARMNIGQGNILLTTPLLYKRKIAKIRSELPDLKHIILFGEPTEEFSDDAAIHFYEHLLANTNDDFVIENTDPEDLALLHFTSGTTGTPKGAMHVHAAVLAHHITAKYALDLHESDIYWCTADPGWVTGTSYGIIAPLTHGLTLIIDEAEFDAEHWYQLIEQEKVTVWYTAPTAIRMMMKQGKTLAEKYNTSSLRFIASVGEPLNPEAVRWGIEAFELPIHDNWWQTETGGIMIANFAAMDIKPGSMGRPLPGIEAAIVKRDESEQLQIIDQPNIEGELALRVGWPSMFRGYLGQKERYKKAFADSWYLSGDLAKKDEDGYFWFVGRADDVIKSAGHLIGPFEVESALIEHPAVAEAAVIGKPDELLMEVVKAFVTLNPGYENNHALQRDLMAFARKRLGPAVAPREIEVKDSLPRTRSGKIMRRLLKARELGLPEGDTSTLESQ